MINKLYFTIFSPENHGMGCNFLRITKGRLNFPRTSKSSNITSSHKVQATVNSIVGPKNSWAGGPCCRPI